MPNVAPQKNINAPGMIPAYSGIIAIVMIKAPAERNPYRVLGAQNRECAQHPRMYDENLHGCHHQPGYSHALWRRVGKPIFSFKIAKFALKTRFETKFSSLTMHAGLFVRKLNSELLKQILEGRQPALSGDHLGHSYG